MANLTLVSAPDEDYFYPAYNCVEFCFNAPDFKQADGTKATFTLELADLASGYGAGADIVVAGQTYTTGTANTYNTIDTAPIQTKPDFAANCKEAFEKNKYLFNTFTFEVSGDELIATAREVGVLANFVFDYSSLGPTNTPINSDTNGTEDEYLENYRAVIEVWECSNGELVKKISEETRIPDADGDFCINVGDKLAPFLETRLTCYEAMTTPSESLPDFGISMEFCLRYGELYSDDLSECNVEARGFETSDPFTIVNGAFQDENYDSKFPKYYSNEWLTSMPQYRRLCDDTQLYLWMNIKNISPEILEGTAEVRPYYELTYTDGSVFDYKGSELIEYEGNEWFFSIGAGIPSISPLLDPTKVLESWKVSLIVEPQPSGTPYLLDEYYFKRDGSCCENQVDFCFLNEFGAYDNIFLERISSVNLQMEQSIFESFIGCGGDGVLKGKEVLNNSAFEVFTATSKFSYDYEDREWLRQFIMSPKKFAKFTIDGKEFFSKVVFLDTSFIYWDEQDNTVRLTVQFILNKNLKIQRN